MADEVIYQDPAAGQAQAGQGNVVNVNELKTLFSNPKADIPIFYGDHTRDTVTAKFMFDRIKIAQTTYNWSDATTPGNFQLALREHAIDWLNYIKDNEQVNLISSALRHSSPNSQRCLVFFKTQARRAR